MEVSPKNKSKKVIQEMEDALDLATIGLNQDLGGLHITKELLLYVFRKSEEFPSDFSSSSLEALRNWKLRDLVSEADARSEIKKVRRFLDQINQDLNLLDKGTISNDYWSYLKPQKVFLVFGILSALALVVLKLTPKPEAPKFSVGAPRTGPSEEWRYTFEIPEGSWNQMKFNDSKWSTGKGPFGTGYSGSNESKTAWLTPSIWLRREFYVKDFPKDGPFLSLFHDDDVEVFLNGNEIFRRQGYSNTYVRIKLEESKSKLLKKGKNILAVHCTNKAGPGFINLSFPD